MASKTPDNTEENPDLSEDNSADGTPIVGKNLLDLSDKLSDNSANSNTTPTSPPGPIAPPSPIAPSRPSLARPLNLLICSGNLGNAEPDAASLAAWIPEDGICADFLEKTKYPIAFKEEDLSQGVKKASKKENSLKDSSEKDNNTQKPDNNTGDNTEDNTPPSPLLHPPQEKFDLIVLGMQESTFEPMDKAMIEEIKAEIKALEDAGVEVDPDLIISTPPDPSSEPSLIAEATAEEELDIDEADAERQEEDMAEYTKRLERTSSMDSTSSVGSSEKSPSKRRFTHIPKKAVKGLSKAANKTGKVATKTATQTAKIATKTGKIAAKTTYKTGKIAAKTTYKTAKTGTKMATTAAITGTKMATNSVEQVSKSAEKAARMGVSTIDTLTASRDHTKKEGRAERLISDGTSVLHKLIQERLVSYTRLLSFQRGEMRLLIYSLNKHHSASVKSVRAQNTGRGGLANKGGIVAEVVVDKGTTLGFMSCHLEAHEGNSKYEARCQSLQDILKGTRKYALPSIYPDASLANHYCFVLGDLNFRTRYKGQIKYEEQGEQVFQLVEAQNWRDLNQADELHWALTRQDCLYGFQTLFCNFPPTFKMDREKGYNYKKQRTPSYTDRILWKTGDKLNDKLKPLGYEPIDDFTTSDHKPVRGAFRIELNQKVHLRKKEHIHDDGGGSGIGNTLKASVFNLLPNAHAHSHHHQNHHEVCEHENLHLFVCDIKADIFPTAKTGGEGGESSAHGYGGVLGVGAGVLGAATGGVLGAAGSSTSSLDTYVCLVSTPEDLLLKKPSKWDQYKSSVGKFLGFSGQKVDSDGGKDNNSYSAGGWPRTGIAKDTHNPEWPHSEVHCILKTHQEDGFPINLTGALLHIFVYKYNARQTDELIGSYPVNLEHLIRATSFKAADTARKGIVESSLSNNRRLNFQAALQKSIRNLRRPSSSDATGLHDSGCGTESMVSIEIDGPLLKNGKQTGMLRCTVDAWWIHDAMSGANAIVEAPPTDADDTGMDTSAKSDITPPPTFGTRHGKKRFSLMGTR